MDEASQILTLEELAIVKVAISLWSNEYLRRYMKKQSNSLVKMDEAVNLLKQKINSFELSRVLAKKLTDLFERVGYEIHVFMSENILNSPNINNFKCGHFSQYTAENLNLSDLKWNEKGEILVCDTLTLYMRNHPTTSPFLSFMCACEICDEKNVYKIWSQFTDDQKNQVRKTRNWSKNFLFLNYWLCLLDNNLDDFLLHYGNNILTYDQRRSLHYNLLKYSIMRCFRSNITYFYSKLANSEKSDFFKVVEINGKNAVLFHVVQMEAFWYMKYINKYFEVPKMNHKINKFIVERLSKFAFKDLIDYNIKQVGQFGDLQCNIFLYLLSIAPSEVKSLVIENLDFYVLSLIGKGKIKPVKFLLTEENKKILCRRIISDLENSINTNRISIICMNNYSYLLEEFFDLIAESEDNRLFLKTRLNEIRQGAQYDNL